jgi:hypothetical protein
MNGTECQTSYETQTQHEAIAALLPADAITIPVL